MGASPREVALGILAHRFGTTVPSSGASGSAHRVGLASFQEEALVRLRPLLERRGGAILADSVGLGKTRIGVALVDETLARGGDAVVLVPASLRPLWLRESEALATGRVSLLSHAELARGRRVGPPDGPRLIVVDEAHRFRNPGTLRRAALERLACGTRLLLITATPVNNGPADLLRLIQLFSRDDALRDVGVPSLRSAFAEDGRPGQRAAVTRELVVRRTRAMVGERFEVGGLFPRRQDPRIVEFDDPSSVTKVEGINALELAAYRDPRTGPDGAIESLIRSSLLKRLDSSDAAFRSSVSRLRALSDSAHSALVRGRVLDVASESRRWRESDGDPLQLSLVDLITRPAPPDADVAALSRAVGRDIARLDALLAIPSPGATQKLAALLDLLRHPPGIKTVVFTEYRDTAEFIWRSLVRTCRAGRVDGGGAWLGIRRAGRRAVVTRFAPAANGRAAPPPGEAVDVLVATDVLSEGLNLQDARQVVCYDLPWNPVRILQRIGRLDRLGCPHDEITPVLFVPTPALEEALRLRRAVRSKLGSIAETVGTEHVDVLLAALSIRDPDAAARAMDQLERSGTDTEERLRTLWVRSRVDGQPSAVQRRPPRPIVGRLAVAPSHGAAGVRWILAVRTAIPPAGGPGPRRARLIEVDRSGEAREAGPRTVAALETALRADAEPGDGEPERGRVDPPSVAAVVRLLQTVGEVARAPTPIPPRDPAARVTRRIRRALADAGSALDPGTIALADRALRRLASPMTSTEGLALESLLARSGPDGVADDPTRRLRAFLEAIPSIGSQPEPVDRGVDREPAGGPEIEVLAGLRIHVPARPRIG